MEPTNKHTKNGSDQILLAQTAPAESFGHDSQNERVAFQKRAIVNRSLSIMKELLRTQGEECELGVVAAQTEQFGGLSGFTIVDRDNHRELATHFYMGAVDNGVKLLYVPPCDKSTGLFDENDAQVVTLKVGKKS